MKAAGRGHEQGKSTGRTRARQARQARRGGGVWATVLAVVLVSTAVVVFSLGAFRGSGNATSPNSGSVTAEEEQRGRAGSGRDVVVRVHHTQDRPGWAPMVEHLRRMHEHYLALWGSGELGRHAPDGITSDPVYARAFLLILADMVGVNLFGGESGTDPEELDDAIDGRRARADELERRFLAGEPLGREVRITRDDGSVFHSDGTYAGEAPAGVDHPTRVTDPEEAARNFVPRPDWRGTYHSAAAELAGFFGVEVDYRFDNILEHCTGGDLDRRFVIAAVCSHTPDRIYVNEDHGNYPDSARQPYWFDAVRHELAHLQILDRCGTTRPAVIAATPTHHEAVTNSYAVLYLGMDRELARQANDGFTHYYTSPESDAAAREIRQGRCG